MKTEKLNRIYVPHGSQIMIAKALGCTKEMVCYALAGSKNTELAMKIRHSAMTAYDGIEINKKSVTN